MTSRPTSPVLFCVKDDKIVQVKRSYPVRSWSSPTTSNSVIDALTRATEDEDGVVIFNSEDATLARRRAKQDNVGDGRLAPRSSSLYEARQARRLKAWKERGEKASKLIPDCSTASRQHEQWASLYKDLAKTNRRFAARMAILKTAKDVKDVPNKVDRTEGIDGGRLDGGRRVPSNQATNSTGKDFNPTPVPLRPNNILANAADPRGAVRRPAHSAEALQRTAQVADAPISRSNSAGAADAKGFDARNKPKAKPAWNSAPYRVGRDRIPWNGMHRAPPGSPPSAEQKAKPVPPKGPEVPGKVGRQPEAEMYSFFRSREPPKAGDRRVTPEFSYVKHDPVDLISLSGKENTPLFTKPNEHHRVRLYPQEYAHHYLPESQGEGDESFRRRHSAPNPAPVKQTSSSASVPSPLKQILLQAQSSHLPVQDPRKPQQPRAQPIKLRSSSHTIGRAPPGDIQIVESRPRETDEDSESAESSDSPLPQTRHPLVPPIKLPGQKPDPYSFKSHKLRP